MFTPTLARRPLLATGLAIACLALGATASLAASPNAPFVGSFYDQSTFTDTVPGDYPCFPGMTRTITATDTVSGHYNNAPAFFHFEGTETFDYRINFADGRYVIGGWTAHFAEEANAESGTVHQLDSGATHERATVYAADGSPSGTVTVFSNFHTAWTDSNHDGHPDPGEIRAIVDHVRVTCG
jgi:hypothetical protein